MKKIVLVLIVALMGTMAMNAQPPQGSQMAKHRLEQLDKALGLDKDQKALIGEILKEGMKQMDQERPANVDDENADKANRMSHREQIMKTNAAIDAKIADVLKPEQRKKFEQMRLQEQKREGDKGHRSKDRRHRDHKMAPKQGDCCDKENGKGCCDQPKGEEQPQPVIE